MSRSTRLAAALVVGLLVVTAASAGFAVAQDAGGSVGDTTQDAENTTSDTTDTTDETAERTTADGPSTSDATTETTDTASNAASSTGDATSDSETTTTDSGTESDTASNSETPTVSETETDVASADTTDSSAETNTSDASTAGTDASVGTVPADTDETASTETTEAATTDATTSNSTEPNSSTDPTGDAVESAASTPTNSTDETDAATETAGQSANSETVGSAGDTVTNETGTQQPPETETPADTNEPTLDANQSSADAAEPTADATKPSADATNPTANSSPSVNDSADGTPETGTDTPGSESTPDTDSGSVQGAMDSAGQVADDENQTATDAGDASNADGGALKNSTGDDTSPVEEAGLEMATAAASALTDAAGSSGTPDSTTSSNDSQLSEPISDATTEPSTETDVESAIDESTKTVANSSVNQTSESVSDTPVDESSKTVSSSTLGNLSEAVSDSVVDEPSTSVGEIESNVDGASNETLTSPTGVESVTETAAKDVNEETSDVGDELTNESVTGDELQLESTTDEVNDANLTSEAIESTDVPTQQDSLTNDALDTGDSELGSTDDADLTSISSVSETDSVLDTETVDAVGGSELTDEVASLDVDSNPVDEAETVTDTVDVTDSTTNTVELDSVSMTTTQDSTTIQSLDESAVSALDSAIAAYEPVQASSTLDATSDELAQTTSTFDAVDETAEIASTDIVGAEQITLASNDITSFSADGGQTTTEAAESLGTDESMLSATTVDSLQEPVTGSGSRSLSSDQVEGEPFDTVSELGTPESETNAGQVTAFADEPLDTTAGTVNSLDDTASRTSANARSAISEPLADGIQSSTSNRVDETIPSVGANDALSERPPVELEESIGIDSVEGLSDRSSSLGVPVSVDHVDSRALGLVSTLGQHTGVTDQRDLDVDARQFDETTGSFDAEPVGAADEESVDDSELDSTWSPSKSDSAPRNLVEDSVNPFDTGDFDQQLLDVPFDATESASFGALFGVSALTIGFAARRFFGDPLVAMPGLVAIHSQAMFLHARTAISNAWPRVLPFPGYSRYDQSDPLENDARNVVYETVEQSPGAYMTELSENVDIPRSTVRYHVRILEEEGLVSGAKVRGKRRFYPVGVDDVDIVAALEDDATAAILDAISRLGPATGSRLANELDRDPSTVSHHLSRLEDASLVERTRDGGAVVNRLTPDAREALLNADMPPDASDSSRTVNA